MFGVLEVVPVAQSELARVEAARASGPSAEEIAAGGGGDDLLPLAEAARLAGVTARYLRGLARRWEQHRTEIEQAREEGRPLRRAYIGRPDLPFGVGQGLHRLLARARILAEVEQHLHVG